jgi:leader peptidase (prepilin peptidase)/N-methyltransferase
LLSWYALAPIALSPIAGWFAAPLVGWQAEGKPPHPAITIAGCMAIALWAAVTMPATLLLPLTCVLGWTLLALAMIDALALRLPDVLTLPLIAAGLLASLWLADRDPVAHTIGAGVGFAVFYAIQLLYYAVRGREGLGLGDAKLAAAAGAWLGWQALPSVTLIACAVAFVWVGIGTMKRGKRALEEQIAFGVPLCLGIWVVWLYGTPAFFGA